MIPDRSSALHAASSNVLIGLLPLLAIVALYLPSGIYMPFRLATVGLAVLAVWDAVKRPAGLPWITLIWTAGVAGCFLGFGALAWFRFSVSGLDDAVRVVLLFALMASTVVAARRRRTLSFLLGGWIAAGTIAAMIGAWETVTGHHLPRNLLAIYAAKGGPQIDEPASVFDNPNLYAYMCAVVVILAPVLFTMIGPRWRWLVGVPIVGLLGWQLVATSGRMAILATAAAVALWLLRSRWGWVAFAASLVATVVAFALSLPVTQRLLAEVDSALIGFEQRGASSWVRLELIRNGWWIVEQTSYLGAGPGAFAEWSLREDNPFRYEALNNAHFGIIEIVSEYGVVTLVVVLVSLAAAAVVCFRTARRRPHWGYDAVLAYAGLLLAVLLPVLSASHSTWLRQPLSALHCATLVAILAHCEVSNRDEENLEDAQPLPALNAND